jgi:hypothetical protein
MAVTILWSTSTATRAPVPTRNRRTSITSNSIANVEMETNLITPSWGSESGRKGGLADTRVYKEVAMAKLTTKQKPNLFVAAMGVYERVGARSGPGGCHAPTLGRGPMGSDTIHGPTAQKAVTQHPDRFWTSTYFSDSRRLKWNLDMRPAPLESL